VKRQPKGLVRRIKQLERKLEALQGYYEDLLGSLQDGVVVLDLSGKVQLLNPAAEELFGLSAQVATGKIFSDLLPHATTLKALVRKTLETRRNHADFDLPLEYPNGGRIHLSAIASILYNARGEARGIVLVVRDLSRIRELEEKLRLRDRLAALGAVASGVAHELRNPLAGIRGAAQLMEGEVGFHPALKEYTSVIVREVDRLSGLVESLLAFARPKKPRLIPLNINQLLEEILLLEEGPLRGRGVLLERLYDPQLPSVLADPPSLRQVLLNLLRNGAEAMPSGGVLSIRTRYEHFSPKCGGVPAAVVEITDQGEGIPPEAQAHLFEPFFTTKEGGTGLGLAISLKIVEDHGGAMEVISRRGKGTTVLVLLPLLRGRERESSDPDRG